MTPRNQPKLVCVICGSDSKVQNNHIGGKNHIAFITFPFCERHHSQFHRLTEGVGIDLKYTPDRQNRLVQAAQAMNIALWMVLQALGDVVPPPQEKK